VKSHRGGNSNGQLGQASTANIGDTASSMGDNLVIVNWGTGVCVCECVCMCVNACVHENEYL